ncbi:UDP-N-acetylmuramoyl-tripeptide--D-alanyl-D-alanine ligase [Candidatus Babeliales bacterium]|nr:UDP-N-acetylmuramoyl-tripeptide--D-alanyl-D-alanine ligase [Candidatus Babeliales bacterium]
MSFSRYFLKVALPTAVFKVGNSSHKIDTDNFFENNFISGFCIDSRKIKQGEIFLALEGENVDGHDFVEDAIKNGAIGIIINQEKEWILQKIKKDVLSGKLIIIVKNTLNALIQLAKVWRSRFCYPVVGITGSVGKTTTKEIVSHIFKIVNFTAYVSYKNQNSLIGLCLNILNMRKDHKVAVFEVGISKIGEMEVKADILRPTIALITCIAHSHTYGLGKLLDIANQKNQIFKYFNSCDIGIINGDQPILSNNNYNYPTISFGMKIKNHLRAGKIRIEYEKNGNDLHTNFMLKIYNQKISLRLKGNHEGLIYNSLAASSIAYLLGISVNDIIKGLQTFSGVESRFEKKIASCGNGTIINDCYNANPKSMKAAIFAFSRIKCSGVKIAVLGDMLELGEREVFWHRQVGRVLRKVLDLDFLILVGNLAKHIAKTAPMKINIIFVSDWIDAEKVVRDILKKYPKNHSFVLAKSSKAMNLNKMVEQLSN